MIHITDHTTYVVVALDGVPRFVRIIPIEVPTSTMRLRSATEDDHDAEEEVDEFDELLAPAGINLRSRASMRVGTTVGVAPDPAVADLVHRLSNTVQFANARAGAAPVHAAYISGAGAAIPGIHAALAEVLGMRVDFVNIGTLANMRQPLEGEFALDAVGTLGIVYGEGI